MSELKPCPFCGPSAPVAIREEMIPGFIGWRVKCTGPCGVSMPGAGDYSLFTSKDIAIMQWNRRAPDPEKQVMQDDIAFLNGRVRQLANFDYMAEKERMRWEHQREKQELVILLERAKECILWPDLQSTPVEGKLLDEISAALLRRYKEKP